MPIVKYCLTLVALENNTTELFPTLVLIGMDEPFNICSTLLAFD